MPTQPCRIARVIDVISTLDGSNHVVVMTGDQEHEIIWTDTLPAVGDVFLAAAEMPLKIWEKIGSSTPGAWCAQGDGLRWRRRMPNNQTRMDILWQRHVIRRAVREYFDSEGFIEIDAPLLVHGTTPDASINSFVMEDRFLITSTEYQIKRLEVGGFERIYTLTQNFRKGDIGLSNSPEFTMLEWARVGVSLDAIESDAEQLTWRAHTALGGDGIINYEGHKVNLQPPWERLTVAEAITKSLGVAMPDFNIASLKHAVQTAGIPIRAEWEGDRIFLFSVLLDHIQQYLGIGCPVFLRDWPAFLTSSAKEKSDYEFAERSELFIAGVELSDGFPSLTDYDRQLKTFQQQIIRRKVENAPPVLLDDAYLESLRVGLPSGAGMALGFDRLVMLLTGQTEILPVLAFAWDEV